MLKDQHRPVNNMQLGSGVAGCEGRIAGDHHQLVAGLLEDAQGWLALRLQGAVEHSEAPKFQPALDVLPALAAQL